jgi:hypothetical protein
MTFMQDVKDAVIHELWGTKDFPLTAVDEEDWRRISVGIMNAGAAIVPHAQVRILSVILRLLEDEYLLANHMRAMSGDYAAYHYFKAQEEVVLEIMMQVRVILRVA